MVSKGLHYSKLKNFCTKEYLNFETTKDLLPSENLIGQTRAAKSIVFGLNTKSEGYNIFISGLPGTGKTTFAKIYAKQIAKNEPAPQDLCYVYNFKEPKNPKPLILTQGIGKKLKDDMDELVGKLVEEVNKAFTSKEFDDKKNEIISTYQNKRNELIDKITEDAKLQNFGVKSTNTGIYFMPLIDGEILTEEDYELLSNEEKFRIEEDTKAIQKKASESMHEIKNFEHLTQIEVKNLEFSASLFTVGYHISLLLEKYSDYESITDYLLDVKEDILENIEDFLKDTALDDNSINSIFPWVGQISKEERLEKYKINLLTDNSNTKGAPVIIDFNPTYQNLTGQIEVNNESKLFVKDFMNIKQGLFHEANGGYLILNINNILSNSQSLELIKRVLITNEINIDLPQEINNNYLITNLKPQPIKCNIKIILIGPTYIYETLCKYDSEFKKLFKVHANFDYEMNYNKDNIKQTLQFIKSFINKKSLLDFDVNAVSKIIEYSTRLAQSQEKLTTKLNKITDLLIESNSLARQENLNIVTAEYVNKAIKDQNYRDSLLEEKILNLTDTNIILIDTSSAKIGQVNGLAVHNSADYVFAAPTKITATAYVGKSGIVNIEKEAKLSGNIHNKGIQVLIGYLGYKYAQKFPLSLSCQICFEQNYTHIDGDSASSAELYAVLSSLSNIKLNQQIAVTGSINQYGDIQPVGGVTYKVEGFFNLCNKRGLIGNQGVIIPHQNINELVLKDEVIEAVKNNLFHIYPIHHVDEGIEILTGIKAGTLDQNNRYEPNTINYLVIQKLYNFYKNSISE